MAIPFISSITRKEVREIRGYFMRHVSGPDVGFSWDENDPRYPADQWERIPAGAMSLGNLPDDLDFEMRKMRAVHEFLLWNRAQGTPLVEVTKEYGVANKVLELARIVGLLAPEHVVTRAALLDEARRALSSLLDAIRGVPYVESTRSFGQQVLEKIEAADVGDEPAAPPADASEGADARLVCKVARQAGTPISVETARAILAALASQATLGPDAPRPSKDN